MNVYAIFDSELYAIYNENDELIHSCINYDELCMWCNEHNHNLLNVIGLDDD